MKDRRLLVAIVGAALVAVLVVIFSAILLGSNSSGDKTIVVSVAIEGMAPGKKITATDIKQITIPQEKMPAGVLIDVGSIINRTVKDPINPGDVIVESKLFANSLGGNLASDIPVGQRAFTIAINEVSGVGGFASPGSYVDVMLSGKDAYGQPYSKIIVQHAKVLAISQLRTEDGSPKIGNSATLQVSPQEVQQLDVARTLGTLTLVLRNIADQKTSSVSPTSNRGNLDVPGQAAVEVIRGSMTADGQSGVQRQ